MKMPISGHFVLEATLCANADFTAMGIKLLPQAKELRFRVERSFSEIFGYFLNQ